MYIVEKVDDWDVVVDRWVTDDLERAERFAELMRLKEGPIYPEYSYYCYEISEFNTIPDISDEELNKVRKDYYKRKNDRLRELKQINEVSNHNDYDRWHTTDAIDMSTMFINCSTLPLEFLELLDEHFQRPESN